LRAVEMGKAQQQHSESVEAGCRGERPLYRVVRALSGPDTSSHPAPTARVKRWEEPKPKQRFNRVRTPRPEFSRACKRHGVLIAPM
jgi:hypothetical protein